MKILKFSTIILILLSCSNSSESKKKDQLPGPPFEGYKVRNAVYLDWEFPLEADNVYGVYIEQSTDNINFENVASFFDRRKTTTIYNLTYEVTYYFRAYYDDPKENPSEFSTTITLTPTTGQPVVDEAWTYFATDLQKAYDTFSLVIDQDLDAAKNAREGRGWSMLKMVDGDKSQIENIAQMRADFSGAFSLMDAKAGSVITSLLESNFTGVIVSYNAFRSTTNYQHAHLNHINSNYMHLHGAIGYWFEGHFDTVNEILDKLDSGNAPHNLSSKEQISKLNGLMNGVERPK